jgi:hypothetical protein
MDLPVKDVSLEWLEVRTRFDRAKESTGSSNFLLVSVLAMNI